MSIKLADIKEKLRARQYKLTPQRQAILQVFIDNQEMHLSAEDVYDIVREKDLDIGVATIYRTLELLSDMDILQKLNFGDGCSRYEINESTAAHHHHHLICLGCGEVKEFDDDLMETLESVIAHKSNFLIVDHQVKFYGYCQECQKNREH